MEIRTKRIVVHLISLELRKRQSYWSKMKKMPKDFSDVAIAQMKQIVEKKDISRAAKDRILTEIKTFELTTR